MSKTIVIHHMILTILAIIRERQLSHESLNWRNQWYKTYDFIVVGSGAAGSVVAARLAEDVSKSILLIEAGGPQNIASDIPAFYESTFGTELDWNYPIVPQRHAYWAYKDNQKNIHRGRAFGGSTMHNEMNFYRESPEYFDFWTEITGVKNWTYSHVLRYFRKSENNLDQSLVANDPKEHNRGGLISLITVSPNQAFKAYLKGAEMMGYPMTFPDGRLPFGSTIYQKNIRKGVRQTTSLVFLEHKHRRNLHILGQTLVTKILFNEKKRAVGVQFFRNNNFHNVFVRSEVIISGGTINSPHLLMLSGIGPKEHLRQFEIPVISDLKGVGNFLSFFGSQIYFDLKDQTLVKRESSTLETFYNYFVHGSGLINSINNGNTNFHQVHYSGHTNLTNGFAFFETSFLGNNLEDLVKNFKYKEDWKEFYRPYLNRSVFAIGAGLQKPQGKGRIRLSSKNPFQYPMIDPCILCSEQDVYDLMKTFKLILKIFSSSFMKQLFKIFKHSIPGCNPCHNNYFCDSYIRCYIQTFTFEAYPTGGCRIGIFTDREAVVDNKLRVFGVSGLRVIDSSIFPVTAYQSTAQTIMVGEYGADLIKQEFNIKRIAIK